MRSRRRTRRIVIITMLALLLALLTVLYINYRATKQFSLSFSTASAQQQIPPTYLFSFSGPDSDRLSQPLGVIVAGQNVFVSDAKRGVIDEFNLDGTRIRTFGKGHLQIPLYFAVNPKDNNLYVSDRGTKQVEIFKQDGSYVGVFDPKLPKSQLPKFNTHGYQWEPVALAFAPDGSLYATEILNGHRLLIFGPDGAFKTSVGTAGFVNKATDSPELFQFPNSMKVFNNQVWIADSNNRRVKVYDLQGKFVRIVPTSGLPRGFSFLYPMRGESKSLPARFAIVDTLSHDVTIWSVKGDKLVTFGTNGVLEGQFSYPNDLSVDTRDRIYIADSMNSRIQVWGWPQNIQPIPMPSTPAQWAWCLLPLLLLPLLLLRRKRRFVVTPDFIRVLALADEIDLMPGARRLWIAHEDDMPEIEQITFGENDQRVVDVVTIQGEPHSESDAKALMDRLELSLDTAKIITLAKRGKVFLTEDAEMRRVAKLLEIDVLDHDEFAARFRAAKPPTSTEE